MALSDEDKQRFLDLTQRGWNRGAAAREIGTTGTRLRRMVDDSCASYDHEFSQAYLAALAHIEPDGSAPQPRLTDAKDPSRVTGLGHTRWREISEAEADRFLELVSSGLPKLDAAREIGTSPEQLRQLASHDPAFAEALQEAVDNGHPALQDILRSKAFELAIEHNDYKALRDLLVVHLPEYAVLRTTRHEVGGYDGNPIQIISEVFPSLPSHVLDELITAIENKQIDASKVIDMLPQHTGTNG